MNQFYLFMVPVGIITIIIAAKVAEIIKDIAPFAYPNARIMAKQGKLLQDSRFEELSESKSLEEIVNLLKETEYTQYLSQFVGEDHCITDIERALNNHLASVYNQIYAIAPDSMKTIFEVLLKRWDIENIIRTLRCIYAQRDPKDYMIYIGTFSESTFDQLSKSRSIEEVAMSVPYEFENVLNNIQGESLVVIENTLLKHYYFSLWQLLDNPRSKNLSLLREYFGTQIDVINIMAALRLNYMKETGETTLNLLPVTYLVSEEDFRTIVSAEDINLVVNTLSKMPYGKIFEDNIAEYEKRKDIAIFEKALKDMIIQKGKDISVLNPLGIGPAIGYLSQKEAEVRKLKAIVIGSFEGIAPEKIKYYVGAI
ncbi:MAG: ATP synthase A1 subunit C [Candidatus Methanofastidiosia archaeon]